MNKYFTFLLVLLVSGSAVLSAQRSPDPEMARLYARYAWNAYKDKDWQEFANLVEKGVEFDRENPDLLCFQGVDPAFGNGISEVSVRSTMPPLNNLIERNSSNVKIFSQYCPRMFLSSRRVP